MAQTWLSFQPALKETWTQQEFETQFYDDNPFLQDLERTSKHTVGEYANVPLLTNRNGGYSATQLNAAAIATLNPAGNVGVNQGQFFLAPHYQQVSVDHRAIISSAGNANAVASAVDTEIEGASSNLRKQLTRQVFQDGTALICPCGTTTASTTVVLDPVKGYDALVRGWLDTTATIDIGTTASQTSVASARQITGVNFAAGSPNTATITISGAAVTTSSSHFISISGNRSGTTSFEMNGLGNIISQSAALGGIAAGGRWQAAMVDSTTTDLSLDAMLAVQEQVRQFAGSNNSMRVVMGFKQGRRFYSYYQNQVRFDSSDKVGAGSTEDLRWNGALIQQHVDCPSNTIYFVNMDNLLLVTSPLGVHWANEITGGEKLSWGQGTTGFVGVLAYPLNLAANKRNSMAAMNALT